MLLVILIGTLYNTNAHLPIKKGEKNMGNFKQIDFAKRVTIETYLNENKTASYIAEALGVNKSSITREVKRNRHLTSPSKCIANCVCSDCMKYNVCKVKSLCENNCRNFCRGCSLATECTHKETYECKRKNTFPYVCNGCVKKSTCPKEKIEYIAMIADTISTTLRSTSREGLNMTEEEFSNLNQAIKDGVDKGQSIYHLVETKQVNRCTKSIYNYIDRQLLTTKNIDLPNKVKLKKRKSISKKYEYSENSEIDRSGRMFTDFLKYKMENKVGFYVQMDFLGYKENSPQKIFTLTFLPCEFIWVAVFNRNSTIDDVIKFFDKLESKFGSEKFKSVFGTILTDRDILFNKFEKFETSSLNKEKRMHLFYCDPAASHQKANVENSNGQLRRIFPKEDIIEDLNETSLKLINSHLNNRSLASLGGMRAFDAFKLAFGEEILHLLDVDEIDPKDVKIINYRAYK